MDEFFMMTERLGFRCWRPSDDNLAHELWGNAEVTRYTHASVLTRTETTERLRAEIAEEERSHLQYWPIFALADGTHVGACGLRPWNDTTQELGFHLRPEHWGRGYAREAARRVIRHAFEDRNAARLFAGHHPENQGSQRLLEQLGFRFWKTFFYAPTQREHPSYLLRAPHL
ncbi:MAG: GNAT family N-acetyltransferase [Myxococcota bacterium]